MSVVVQKNAQEEIHVSRCEYMGRDVVNMRVWYLAKDGEKHPTRKGVAFSAALLPQILDALTNLSQQERCG